MSLTNKRHEGSVDLYNSDFLDCREGHEWHWLTDWNIVRGPGGRLLEFTRLKQCGRCKTLAHRTFDGKSGRVVRTRYDYADGYLTSEKDRIDAGRARLELLRRAGYVQ
jgi:hypothetical protein